MIEMVLFSVGWAISAGLLVIVALVYRDCKKVIRNANKAALYDDLDARIAVLQRELEEILPQIAQAREDKQAAELDAEAARGAKLESERELETVRAEIQRIQDQIKQLEPERDELRKTREALDRTRLELTDAQKKTSEQMTLLGTAQAEMAAAIARRDEAARDLHTCEQRLPTLRTEVVTLEVRINDLLSTKTRIEKEIETLEEHLRDLKEQISLAEKTKSDLAGTVAALKRQIREAEGSLAGLRDQSRILQGALETLTKTVGHHGGYVEVPVEEALSDLTISIPVSFRASRELGMLEEGAALERLSTELEEAGLQFHPRILHAFHTSLKTADFNQLTVLAGVSGTGKSLLPRAYADSMGINSLVVPVQPGWAGPQDLLGFFNYLERKYKATDLSRHLARYSQFAGEDLGLRDFEEAGSLKDQLLLVLLDEMNLARVEYYFSEFLSRLEMRASIDSRDEDQRRRVAIPLDTGPLKDSPRRPVVYPDTNILFVGTMNEDESTQSLSEKVVDRANVLRFGSPDVESFLRKKDSPGVLNRADDALSRRTWESWCSRTRKGINYEERFGDFRETLGQLIAIMDKLGRPFGHRVHEGMQRYILAYPAQHGLSERDAGRLALTDQIEQKILPKMRGVDIGEFSKELKQLKSILDNLGDKELAKAVEHQLDRPSFEWGGLKREEKDR